LALGAGAGFADVLFVERAASRDVAASVHRAGIDRCATGNRHGKGANHQTHQIIRE